MRLIPKTGGRRVLEAGGLDHRGHGIRGNTRGTINGPIRSAVPFSQLPDGVNNGEWSIHVNGFTVLMSFSLPPRVAYNRPASRWNVDGGFVALDKLTNYKSKRGSLHTTPRPGAYCRYVACMREARRVSSPGPGSHPILLQSDRTEPTFPPTHQFSKFPCCFGQG